MVMHGWSCGVDILGSHQVCQVVAKQVDSGVSGSMRTGTLHHQEAEDKFLDENIEKGYIVPLDSPYRFVTF